MEIHRYLTPYNFSNGSISRVKCLVIHYVGATGGAEANCKYYASKYIGASAHYFVGFEGEVWQSVEDKNVAWHCGANAYKHPECRNSNSIGIELCVRNKGSQAATSRDWYFEDATNEWLLINHHWYLFGKEGYMLTDWQRWNGSSVIGPEDPGDWYFLDNTPNGPLEGACWHERSGGLGGLEIWKVG